MLYHSKKTINVIMIDDNPDHLDLVSTALTELITDGSFRFDIETFTDPADALTHLPAEGEVVIVCDYHLPGGTGVDWLPDFLRQNVGPVILLTGHGDERIAAEAFRAGASDYLVKDTVIKNPNQLLRSIVEALRRYNLVGQNRDLARKLKIANNQLETQNTKLTELTETAHRFVNDVAHEFRTPLTVIKEFASILNDGLGGEITNKQSEFLGHIIASSRDLAHLIDDFLDSSKLKARTLRVDRRRHSVREILDAVRPILQCRAGSRKITISECVDPDCPLIFADAEKTGRVLINLIVNAVKFSPQGSEIEITVKPSGEDEVEFLVMDQGSGMSPDDVAAIFTRFKQLGNGTPSGGKGFGLGLNIACDLVRLNLGELRVQSELDRGSTFAFTVPTGNRAGIIRKYLDLCDRENPDRRVCVLHATPRGSSLTREEFRELFVATCYPMDVILEPNEDGSLVLMGVTDASEKWMARLEQSHTDHVKFNRDRKDQSFDVLLRGEWSTRGAEASIMACVENLSREMQDCA